MRLQHHAHLAYMGGDLPHVGQGHAVPQGHRGSQGTRATPAGTKATPAGKAVGGRQGNGTCTLTCLKRWDVCPCSNRAPPPPPGGVGKHRSFLNKSPLLRTHKGGQQTPAGGNHPLAQAQPFLWRAVLLAASNCRVTKEGDMYGYHYLSGLNGCQRHARQPCHAFPPGQGHSYMLGGLCPNNNDCLRGPPTNAYHTCTGNGRAKHTGIHSVSQWAAACGCWCLSSEARDTVTRHQTSQLPTPGTAGRQGLLQSIVTAHTHVHGMPKASVFVNVKR